MTKKHTPQEEEKINRVIISYEGLSPEEATRRVTQVLEAKVEHTGGLCCLTTWNDGVKVHYRGKRKNQKSHSFVVFKIETDDR